MVDKKRVSSYYIDMDVKCVALVEAALFMETAGATVKLLCEVTGRAKSDVESAITILKEKYDDAGSGIALFENGDKWILAPKGESWDVIKDRYSKRQASITKSTLTTLAIIAYSQPVTRAQIESLRGVNIDGSMQRLRELRLITEVGKLDAPGKPVLYGTTKEFLRAFSLKSIKDLPQLDETEEERWSLAR